MSKPSICDTYYGNQLGLKQRGVEAAIFLAKNPTTVLGKDGIELIKNTVKINGAQSPLTEIYSKVAESGKLHYFTMFDLTRTGETIPPVLTLDDITIDGKYIANSVPQAYKNAWLNLTPILGRRDAYNSPLQITDQLRFASLVARGFLSMSYNDSDEWLTPALNVTMIETYSLLFAMHMRNRFDLNLEEYGLVRTLFAAYYAQMVQANDAKKDVPPILYRCKDIWRDAGSPNAIDERLESVKETRDKIAPDGKLSIATICSILQECGPSRMQKFISDKLVYAFMSRTPSDTRIQFCAIDYPPYFVYQVLANLKNGKNPLFNTLIKFGNMKAILTRFATELITSKMFIDKVVR